MSAATAKKDEPADPRRAIALPHAAQGELIRLSENGSGFIVYGHTTFRDWETVCRPDYFRLCTQLFERFDRIEVVCKSTTAHPQLGTLVVASVKKAANEIDVVPLVGPVEIDSVPASPWDLLGVRRGCSKGDIETAFKSLSRTMHPDMGGTAEDFQRLTAARAECLKHVDG